ncbi:single-stranded DNA-binding protein [Sphingobacterium oryzagri]|uniref:Single-stranded DNA-binding protein n=1 Tax=Sphingobacterium oryzagri TaxID=3025669 RepID=A0ABY7WB59_9SPHI|nr:single-stranded DNA-binding protein [Sphingobacterium sp. KACC 22765]WDF66906.1 single-stranded DNA-binding protein [Sphingobacterium sp. KACC 22765]
MNIIGRVTRDAQVQTTAGGKEVVNFSVAVNDSYKNKQGERVDQTEFFDCTYWLTPKVAKMLVKGLLVELIGRVSASGWTDRDGNPRATLNFHVSSIKPLSGGASRSEVDDEVVVAEAVEDDLPF